MYGAYSLIETPDGSLLFTGAYLEPGQTIGEDEALHTLTKITADGVPLWTKRYESKDIRALSNIVPFQDGYLIQGSMWDSFYK